MTVYHGHVCLQLEVYYCPCCSACVFDTC